MNILKRSLTGAPVTVFIVRKNKKEICGVFSVENDAVALAEESDNSDKYAVEEWEVSMPEMRFKAKSVKCIHDIARPHGLDSHDYERMCPEEVDAYFASLPCS